MGWLGDDDMSPFGEDDQFNTPQGNSSIKDDTQRRRESSLFPNNNSKNEYIS